MKKIQLNVEALRVETFDIEAAAAERGTVVAREATHPYRSDCLDTCDNCPTYSCNYPFNCA